MLGAIISGLLVPYVTDKWQRQSWIFQQEFTLEKSKFDKQLDQKYKILDEVNQVLANILTYSESVSVMKQKGASTAQMNTELKAYNDAVMKWDIGRRVTGMRLKTFFPNDDVSKLWELGKKIRDDIDLKIDLFTSNKGSSYRDVKQHIELLALTSEKLSQTMLDDIKTMEQRDSTKNVQSK